MPTPIKILLFALGLLVLAIVGFLIHRVVIRSLHTRCPNCKHKYNYQRDILPQVKSRKEKNGKTIYRVEYECFCRKCGKERSFFETVKTSPDQDKNDADFGI